MQYNVPHRELASNQMLGGPNRWKMVNFTLSGKRHSLLFLSTTPSCPSRTLGGLFEITRRPSRALEIQGHHQVCRPWCVGTDHQKRLTQTLMLKMHIFLLFQKLETPGCPLTPPILQPPWYHTTSGQHNHKKVRSWDNFWENPNKGKVDLGKLAIFCYFGPHKY